MNRTTDTNNDDTAGHGYRWRAAIEEAATAVEATDTEGHGRGFPEAVEDADTEGHGRGFPEAVEDADTEGHAVRVRI